MRAPVGAEWARDARTVWARAEQVEVRRNARTARELVVALPSELSDAKNVELARTLGQDLVNAYGVAVLVAVHRPDAHGDDRNAHAHLLMSSRVAGPNGFLEKVRVLDDRTTGPMEAVAMRSRVAERINEALAHEGHAARVDARPLRVQVADAVERGDLVAVAKFARTPQRHQGRVATALGRRGESSDIVVRNAAIRQDNAEVGAWAHGRAEQLSGVIHRRARRSVNAPRTSRRQEARKGLGSIGSLAKASGADAELLNAQAQLVQESAHVARDAAEAYLDKLARESDRLAIALRAYLIQCASLADRQDALLEAFRDRRLSQALLDPAVAALKALGIASAEDRRIRRKRAQAEVQTAKARAAEQGAIEQRPSLLRPWRRRQWAEHRRHQRSERIRYEHAEQKLRRAARESGTNLANAERAWRSAHTELVESTATVSTPEPISENETSAGLVANETLKKSRKNRVGRRF